MNVKFETEIFQTVAIMGAHTLGAADPNDSGYAGAWIAGGQDSLNSAFYDDMEDATITWDNGVLQFLHFTKKYYSI